MNDYEKTAYVKSIKQLNRIKSKNKEEFKWKDQWINFFKKNKYKRVKV